MKYKLFSRMSQGLTLPIQHFKLILLSYDEHKIKLPTVGFDLLVELRVGDELLLLLLADSLLCWRLYGAFIELDGELLVGESLDCDEYLRFEVLNRKLGVARKSRSVGRPAKSNSEI